MLISIKRIIIPAMLSVGLIMAGAATAKVDEKAVPELKSASASVAAPAAKTEPVKRPSKSTADHSKFEALQVEFKTGPEVTQACLECHTEAAKQIHKTKHWTWEYVNEKTGQKLGKNNVINNFCTATKTNQGFCSACHIGYGWEDESFDFTSEKNVDCVVCHDTTGTYKKLPGLAGHPNYEAMEWPPKSGKFREATDLTKIAQNVGKTSRATCGACHFYGGGGNAVKHGDLDSSLVNARRYLDVHMDTQGPDFQCSTCHISDSHEVAGSRYATTASDPEGRQIRGQNDGRNKATCSACHGNEPHPEPMERLNLHTRKIACQTCHIPEYARGPLHTKMSWDWSTAGRLDENGKRLKIKGSEGRVIYDSNKGDFTYDRYVIPEYVWFNGEIKFTLFGDTVEPGQLVKINEFQGGPDDPDARIWPTKVFRGKQPIDAEKKTLAVFHTAGKSEAAFWGGYDWDKAIEVGMKAMGVEYSGKKAFVETEMSWPITHMVAPKDDALSCAQCHREGGRLDKIKGVYMPGRDGSSFVDMVGSLLALFTLFGVLVHGGIRVIMSRRRG